MLRGVPTSRRGIYSFRCSPVTRVCKLTLHVLQTSSNAGEKSNSGANNTNSTRASFRAAPTTTKRGVKTTHPNVEKAKVKAVPAINQSGVKKIVPSKHEAKFKAVTTTNEDGLKTIRLRRSEAYVEAVPTTAVPDFKSTDYNGPGGNIEPVPAPATTPSSELKVPPPTSGAKRYKYPERLLIYHGGTARTAFVGTMKLTTVFIFGFFSMLIAPSHILAVDADSSRWFAALAVGAGLTPMLFFRQLSKPFVAYMHILLPAFARNSPELLARYSKNPPKEAKLEITTLNMIGYKRVTRVLVTDLHPIKSRTSLANYSLSAQSVKRSQQIPFYKGRPPTEFAVLGEVGKAREAGLWHNISEAIARRAQ